jgi:hypothetical protein
MLNSKERGIHVVASPFAVAASDYFLNFQTSITLKHKCRSFDVPPTPTNGHQSEIGNRKSEIPLT